MPKSARRRPWRGLALLARGRARREEDVEEAEAAFSALLAREHELESEDPEGARELRELARAKNRVALSAHARLLPQLALGCAGKNYETSFGSRRSTDF